MNAAAAIIFSALAGSFFNMLIYRLNNGVSLFKPRHSICPRCHERLHWFELIPIVSYLLQRGRCNSCGDKISPRYLWVEICFVLTAVVWSALQHNYSDTFWFGLVQFWFIWAIVFSDIEYQEVPYFFSLGFLFLLWHQGLQWLLINLFVWLALFLLIKGLEKFHYKRTAFGGTDFLLLFGIALYFDLPGYVLFLCLAFFLGMLFSVALLAWHKADKDTALPFAPFIMAAFLIAEYWGAELLRLYWSFYA